MTEQIDLLIGRGDITPYAQIAINVRDENSLFPHILAAQNVDVQPVLSGPLFTDLLQNRTIDKYRQLLDGGLYQNEAGFTLKFQGLKAAIACFAYARYLLWKNANDTPFGVVSKKTEWSELADTKLITAIASEKRSEASHYLSECTTFLNENLGTYPLFDSGQRKQPVKSIHRLTDASRI